MPHTSADIKHADIKQNESSASSTAAARALLETYKTKVRQYLANTKSVILLMLNKNSKTHSENEKLAEEIMIRHVYAVLGEYDPQSYFFIFTNQLQPEIAHSLGFYKAIAFENFMARWLIFREMGLDVVRNLATESSASFPERFVAAVELMLDPNQENKLMNLQAAIMELMRFINPQLPNNTVLQHAEEFTQNLTQSAAFAAMEQRIEYNAEQLAPYHDICNAYLLGYLNIATPKSANNSVLDVDQKKLAELNAREQGVKQLSMQVSQQLTANNNELALQRSQLGAEVAQIQRQIKQATATGFRVQIGANISPNGKPRINHLSFNK